MSKTEQAIKYLKDHEGCSVYRAAQMVGLYPSVLYRALKKRGVQTCPTCKRPWPQKVNPMEPD